MRAVLAGALLALAAAAPAHAGDGAVATVETLHAALLDIMKGGGKLGFTGRSDRIAPVVGHSFDFPTIARFVVGREWGKLSSEQQSRFLSTFEQLSTATYAGRFDSFDGERFRTVGTEPQKRGYELVKTELIDSDGDAVSLSYLLHESAGDWKIVNVIADGVSDLSLKRADYASIMKAGGFDALIDKIKVQITQQDKGGGK
ncbi:MAG: ABC transporter substrate-binding protein [Gammaproteobacteria bacterium]